MTEKQRDRLISVLGFGVAAFVVAFFLTNLHRSVNANTFAYTYNTVTGAVVKTCQGIKCFEPSAGEQ
jgi:hypothetical protein